MSNHFNNLLLATLREVRDVSLRLDRVESRLKRLENGLERINARSREQLLKRTERSMRILNWLMIAKMAAIGILLVALSAC